MELPAAWSIPFEIYIVDEMEHFTSIPLTEDRIYLNLFRLIIRSWRL